jgi:hypothetical protein
VLSQAVERASLVVLVLAAALGLGCSAIREAPATGTEETPTGGGGGATAAPASGSSGMGGSLVGSGGAPGDCTPVASTETMCDGLDDDCNGRVDDVDVGGDGICDCLRIGIVGGPGQNPSANFQLWLEERGTIVERTHTTASEVFDAALLAKYDVVVFDRLQREYTPAEADALRLWMEAGGGFITMTGYGIVPVPDFAPNALLEPYGLSYGGSLFNGPVTSFATHPVTEGLTSVTFDGGYLVSVTSVPGGTSTVIGSIPAGPVAYAHERADGRAVVWGDEWIEFDSEWQALPQIEKLWVNIFAWIGPQDTCGVDPPK